MSVFRVRLTQGDQGSLDEHALGKYGASDASLQTPVQHSIQRTVYVMGPKKINRLLKDGDTFTDCNYWKRYAYPQVPREQAIVEVVTDDGSVWVDGEHGEGSGTYPKVYNVSVPANTTFAVNTAASRLADILTDTGSYAVYCQLTLATASTVKVKLNGDSNAIFDLSSTTVQIFNPGDFNITKLEFQNDTGTGGTVQVLLSVVSKSNS